MALRKCPKCELNYIREGEQYCNLCMRAMKNGIFGSDTNRKDVSLTRFMHRASQSPGTVHIMLNP